MTRDPRKWHPRDEPTLEMLGFTFSFHRYIYRSVEVTRTVDGLALKVLEVPTFSGDWKGRVFREVGLTEDEVTAATVAARMMGDI